jgi:hypothetical protein
VAKYAARPALILVHTHPADVRSNPLPSSQDLATAVYFGAHGRFAASAVISRYGALLYTIDWPTYKTVAEAADWNLAVLNLCHDVVAAHEAVRSWAAFSLADYLAFYPRHRLMLAAAPLPDMVGDLHRARFSWDLETPIDHDLIESFREEIRAHRQKASGARARRHGLKGGPPRAPSGPVAPAAAAAAARGPPLPAFVARPEEPRPFLRVPPPRHRSGFPLAPRLSRPPGGGVPGVFGRLGWAGAAGN